MSDMVNNAPHYTVYPVQPIEICRYLGFNLGNAVKYVLRAPYKGGVEDCNKALKYLGWELEVRQAPIPHVAYRVLEDRLEALRGFLQGTGGGDLWDDVSGTQCDFLAHLDGYLDTGEKVFIESMCAEVQTLAEILGNSARGLYSDCSGLPEATPGAGQTLQGFFDGGRHER